MQPGKLPQKSMLAAKLGTLVALAATVYAGYSLFVSWPSEEKKSPAQTAKPAEVQKADKAPTP